MTEKLTPKQERWLRYCNELGATTPPPAGDTGEAVAWAYVNRDGECEQIEWGPVFDDPDVTPLYARPSDAALRGRVAELEARLAAEIEACAGIIDFRIDRLRGNRKRIAQVDQHVISIMGSLAAAIRARQDIKEQTP